MNSPKIRRLSDLSKMELANRSIRRSELGREKVIGDLSGCCKPVWISCFFDGTGNNFRLDGDGRTEPDLERYSNVAKLAHFAHPVDDRENQTYGLYAPGVGTPFPEIGDDGDGIDKAFGMAAASKGEARITWMLNKFRGKVDNHMPHVNQINVAVFGFSRGAAQSRAFVRRLIEEWCREEQGELFWIKSGAVNKPRVVIYFLGIFDTVASVGFGGSRLESSLKYRLHPAFYLIDGGGHASWASEIGIPQQVWCCEHYIASHEVREKFPCDSVRQDRTVPINCRETFYPGAHSDVGGGYEIMTQEGRTNHLSRIPLCNMFLSAYAAGVPFFPPEKVAANSAELFTITADLQKCFEVYMRFTAPADSLEKHIMNHMGNYYHWRWGRTERQRKERKDRASIIAKGQSVVSLTPDEFMTITDREWEEDVQEIAEKRTGFFRSEPEPLEDVIYDAWKGKLRSAMTQPDRELFDRFFDFYVHDSVAGFKNQMSDSYLSIVEASRWSRNRQYFVGKQGKKFLYWRYEGKNPHRSDMRKAMLSPDTGSGFGQTATA